MPKSNLFFPDLSSIIYEEKESLAGIRKKYIESLRKTGLMHNHIYASKLEECEAMLNVSKLKALEREFYDFKVHMRKFCKKKNISLNMTYRLKDFIRLNNKIRSTLISGYSLDKVSDFLGFRIILNTPSKDTVDTIKLAYEVLNEVINFFVTERHGLPLQAEPLKNVGGFVQEKHPDIVVPKESLIEDEFKSAIKDYIMNPKENGYQSLHAVIREFNGLVFEVQIRTFAMDLVAEKGKASHIAYEAERKESSDICLDYSKIQIPGFEYLPSGEVHDMIGLVKAIDPFNHL